MNQTNIVHVLETLFLSQSVVLFRQHIVMFYITYAAVGMCKYSFYDNRKQKHKALSKICLDGEYIYELSQSFLKA